MMKRRILQQLTHTVYLSLEKSTALDIDATLLFMLSKISSITLTVLNTDLIEYKMF